jgi:hypothetical protein
MTDVGPGRHALDAHRLRADSRGVDGKAKWARPANTIAWLLAITLGVSILGYVGVPEIRLRLALRGSTAPQPIHPSIIMLGDSHTGFVNWRVLTGCDNIAGSGVGGNTTAQILSRLPEVLNQRPRLVILLAGTNDALQGVPASDTITNIRTIEKQVNDRGAAFEFIAPPPLPGRDIGALVSISSLSVPFSVEDLLADQVHLRRSGYAKWRDAIAPLISKYC